LLGARASRVVFDEGGRARGVEFVKDGRTHEAAAKREVVLAGGAFNTPQLLMLSGIGPPQMLARFGIATRVALDGVGTNLQDRYEIGVVNRMRFPEWDVYRGARFAPGDPQFEQWNRRRPAGVYTSNGALLSVVRKSPYAENDIPDLFCMSLLGRFHGYYRGFAREIAENLNCLTWVVLKAHTRNCAGTVSLRSTDPFDPPLVDFNYFAQGAEDDLNAMIDGVRFVRKLTAPLKADGSIDREELPGEHITDDESLGQFIRTNAWGHHASCSCPIGSPEHAGVLDGRFRVHGVPNLRVVDASIFPRIPGFFVVGAIYMIAEKAADVMLEAESG
jgi:choline dehydrogenase